MSIHRKLMTSCAVAVLAFGLVACASNDDDNAAMGTTEPMGPTADGQLATLRGEIAELRKQLGIEDDDDLGDSISDLQVEVANLKGKVEDEAAKAHTAKLNKLAMGLEDLTDGAYVQNNTNKPGAATDGDAPHAISDWSGSSYSFPAADDPSTTMAVVYNNREAATSVLFSKEYGDDDDDAEADKDGVYTFDDDDVADKGKLVEMAGLPTHASHDGVQVGPYGGVKGKFNGVPGTFSSDADLRVKVNPMGEATWTGNLNFKPDSATAMVMRADDTYMNLGWWLNENTEVGTLVPMVAAWPTGTGTGYDAGRITSLIGKATFMGIAVGKYTHKTINSIEGGHYNASAELVADFGAQADAAKTLKGTIDGFMQDGQPIGSGWKVELEAADILAGAVAAEAGAVASGTFGTQKTNGTWTAMFDDASRKDSMPGAVGGTFRVGESGHPINMIGAFSASNQEADMP